MISKILIAVAFVVIVGLTGCKHPAAPGQKGGLGANGADGSVPGIAPLGGDGTMGNGERPMADGKWGSHGEFEPVLFDFDSARVRASEVSKLETIATALHSNTKKLVIEGHTDERGTAEYNRALGERRALACREELVRKGIAASRISTISYGKDRPAELGHDESAWSHNRRCEFITVSQ